MFEKVDPLLPCVFALRHGKLDDYLPLMCQLQRAATLPPVEQNGMIAAIVFSMQSRTQFDFASMETVQEKILHKVRKIMIPLLVYLVIMLSYRLFSMISTIALGKILLWNMFYHLLNMTPSIVSPGLKANASRFLAF